MARLIEEKIPTEKTYVFELTQSECDALGSVICDLVDVNRKVVVDYTIDHSRVVPTKRFVEVLTELSDYLVSESDDYDYFEWFEDVD